MMQYSDLAHGTFGTKLLIMSVNRFKEAILLDVLAIFVQKPKLPFENLGYQETSNLIFSIAF